MQREPENCGPESLDEEVEKREDKNTEADGNAAAEMLGHGWRLVFNFEEKDEIREGETRRPPGWRTEKTQMRGRHGVCSW